MLRAFLRVIGLVGLAAVLLETVLVAEPGDADVGSLFLWVYGWVGVAVLSALVGPLWTWLDPFDSLARAAAWLVHRLGFDGPRPATYPARLGRWPALAGYRLLRLAGAGGDQRRRRPLPGPEPGRLHPRDAGRHARLRPGDVAQPRRRRSASGSSCWADSRRWPWTGPRRRAGIRVRGYASGLIRAVWTAPEVAFVALAVAGVIFDGLSQTNVWFDAFGAASVASTTIQLAIFATAIVIVALLASRVAGRAAIGAGLVPIAVGYILAHYLTFLLIDGQRIILVFDDPLSLGNHFLGLAGWEPSGAWLPPPLVWGAMLASVVGGHMVGAVAGHASAAVEVRPDAPAGTPWTTAALGALRRREVPLACLMVGLTVLTLWSLGPGRPAPGLSVAGGLARVRYHPPNVHIGGPQERTATRSLPLTVSARNRIAEAGTEGAVFVVHGQDPGLRGLRPGVPLHGERAGVLLGPPVQRASPLRLLPGCPQGRPR